MTRVDLREDVRRWLAEDVGHGDVTTSRCVPAEAQAVGRFVPRESAVIYGLEPAALVFGLLDARVAFDPHVADGERCAPGQCVATVGGQARAILTGERLALNLLQRLSGVATLTSRYVAAVASTRARILDTRKTTPGLRALEKAAVAAGGGVNHRFGLDDGLLIKDNHLVAAGGVAAAVAAARQGNPLLRVQVEVDTLDQLREALDAGADGVLLDNMTPAQLAAAVALCDGRAWTEASGGVNLASVAAIAATGVDYISVGALTHSAPAVDVGLDFVMG